jgi:dephospho-CoA kinase
MKRDGISREQAIEWIDRQMPQEEKEHRSHYVIVNDGVMPIEEQIEKLLADIKNDK